MFGAPPAADAAKLIVTLGGDDKARKEIAHLLVPSVGRKVGDDYSLGFHIDFTHVRLLIWERTSKNVSHCLLCSPERTTFT